MFSDPVEKTVTHTKTVIYRGKIIELSLENVTLPNGALAELEIVHHPGGAAVVALDHDNRVCLLRQYRHAAGGWLWELPAGKLDAGEPPLSTAQRELEEEAGLRAARWESLGKIISSPGVFTEVVHLFLARDLSSVPANTEAHEVLEVHWVPFTEALARAREGEITDAKTLVGLFRAGAVARQS
jgi:ADP-ribose pyrophosphatase